jgi:hypothetical protein
MLLDSKKILKENEFRLKIMIFPVVTSAFSLSALAVRYFKSAVPIPLDLIEGSTASTER